jgi:hypothetical protein
MRPYPEDEQIQYLSARFTGRYSEPFNLHRFSGLWRDLALAGVLERVRDGKKIRYRLAQEQ